MKQAITKICLGTVARRLCLTLCLSGSWLISDAVGEDSWPEFRGPTGQGVSLTEGLPIHWSSTENVSWKKPVPGIGWSSPVYHQGRIYMTTAVPTKDDVDGDHSLRTLCVDASQGDTIWNVEVFFQDGDTSPKIQSKNSHASPTPIVHDEVLYVHFGHQGTACLDLNGKVLWRTRQIRYAPRHGNGGSPIVVGDLLIFSCDGETDPFVIALDRHTGEQRWRTGRNVESKNMASFSTPLMIEVNGKQLVVSPGSEIVGAYDAKTGQEVWRVQYSDGYSVVPRPVYGQGLVYACSGYNGPMLYAIRPDGQGDVTDTHVEWQTDRNAPHNPSLLLRGNELYMVSDNGIATCLEAKTGKVHWTKRLGGNFSASPLLAGDKIYFQDENGVATVIKAGWEFHRLATNRLDDMPDERTFASYAVGDNGLFLRSEKHLLRIDSTGR